MDSARSSSRFLDHRLAICPYYGFHFLSKYPLPSPPLPPVKRKPSLINLSLLPKTLLNWQRLMQECV